MLGKILAAIGLALAFMGATLLNTAMARAETMDFELELPEGASIDAATMAGALIEALATAPDAQKPALVEALANVLRMNPEERIESPAIAMAAGRGRGRQRQRSGRRGRGRGGRPGGRRRDDARSRDRSPRGRRGRNPAAMAVTSGL